MSRVFAQSYSFDKATKKVTVIEVATLVPESLVMIVDTTNGKTIYMANDPALGGTFSGNQVTLTYDTTGVGFNNSDKLQIIYDNVDIKENAGNIVERDKDGFNSIDTSRWTYPTLPGSVIQRYDGNVGGSSFVSTDLPADVTDFSYRCQSIMSYPIPTEVTLGWSVSQRIFGEQIWMNWVGCDTADNSTILKDSALPELTISSASITIASNSGSVIVTEELSTCALKTGDSVYFYGCDDSRANFGPMLVTAILPATKQITVALVAANATYSTVGGKIVKLPQTDRALYSLTLRSFGATSGNVDFNSRNGAGYPTVENWNPGNSFDTSQILNIGGVNYSTAPGSWYTVAFASKTEIKIQHKTEMARVIAIDQDTNGAPRSVKRKRKEIPDQLRKYRLEWGIDSLKNKSLASDPITAISKTGSTTCTVTIAGIGTLINGGTPGLTNKYCQLYGVRDNTNFPNQTTVMQITVINANQISFVFTGTPTASSYGGFIIIQNGGQGPSVQNNNVQSYRKTADGLRLELTAISNWSEVMGNVVGLHGFVDSTPTILSSLMGKYRVAAWSTTVMELEPLEGQAAAIAALTTTPTNAGGTVVRCTSLRMHYVKFKSRAEMRVDLPENEGDTATATPVQLLNSTLNGNQSVRLDQIAGQGVTTAQNGTQVVGIVGPINNADMASGAKTSSGNTGTITPGNQAGQTFHIGISAVGGTNPTMDLVFQESHDDGTTWYDSYHLPRVTANIVLMTEPLRLNGTRYRWAWTIGGTGSPTFTTIINSKRLSWKPDVVKQFFDRSTIVLTTLGSVTPTYRCDGCAKFKLGLTLGTATTPPQIQLQISDDAVNWTNVGAIITGVASSTVITTVTDTPSHYVRAIVTTLGATLGAGTIVSIRGTP